MLNDIYQTPTIVEFEGKEYSFEFNHAAYAMFEKTSGKSIFEMYENIIENKKTKLLEIPLLLSSAMLKHHTKEEIMDLKIRIENEPWIWQSLESSINNSFIVPLIPPKVLKDLSANTKKKRQKKSKKQAMNG